jgi:hypothetical protein
MLQRQLSHLNGRKLDPRQVQASYIFIDAQLTVLIITSWHGPRRKHRPSLL